jgi:uncharacterized protein YndB with AHSA1/START domain
MGYAEAVETIHAPLEMVWDTLNDIDHTHKWVVGLERAEITTEGSYGVGTVYHDYNRLGPALQVTAWHIVVFEPMTRQVHVSDSDALPSKMVIVMAQRAEGTRVRMSVEYRFMPKWGRFSRLFETLVMNHILSGVLRQNLGRLNAYLRPVASAFDPIYSEEDVHSLSHN